MEWSTLLSEERRRGSQRLKSENDHRSEFEKDYHRIIGSASFRRLQDKTQVFPLDKSDFIRTRLTHSLEVSSIAKSLGQSVGHILRDKNLITEQQASGLEDILLCSGLLHDIGNPPFGHFGETVIRQWFTEKLHTLSFQGKPVDTLITEQMKQDLINFEGNAQSLRVVSKLHYLVDENGMNLTKALMNTIIKYPVSSTEINKDSGDIKTKKMGYFYADREAFTSITSSTGADTRRYPLVYLLEAADDIAYRTADLEDGLKKGVITYHKLLYELENNKYLEYREENTYRFLEIAIDKLKNLLNWALEKGESNPEMYAVQNWIISLQSMLIRAAAFSFMKNYSDIMEGTYKKDLFSDTYGFYLAKLLGEIAFEHIFSTPGILKLEVAANTILESLLNSFVRAAITYDSEMKQTEKEAKLMNLISDNYKKIYKIDSQDKDEGERLYLRMLLVTDYIGGMTDHYAKMIYQELNGIY